MSAPWRSLVEGNENQWLGVWSRSNNRPSSKFVSTWGQCDQIGRIFKSLGSKYSCKSWPNIWQLFRFFWNSFTFAANICGTFVKNCATFYCNTWSRCLGSTLFLISSPSRWTKLWTTYHCLRRGSSSSRGTRRACGSGLGAIPHRRSSRRRCRRRCRREWAEDEELEAVGRGVGAMASGSRRSEDIRRYRRST